MILSTLVAPGLDAKNLRDGFGDEPEGLVDAASETLKLR